MNFIPLSLLQYGHLFTSSQNPNDSISRRVSGRLD